jgi:hypothetical protein
MHYNLKQKPRVNPNFSKKNNDVFTSNRLRKIALHVCDYNNMGTASCGMSARYEILNMMYE